MHTDRIEPARCPLARALACAFATRRFEDGSAAFQMEPWGSWDVVTAPTFPIGARVTARRFVLWRNRWLAPISPLAIFARALIRGAWRPYRVVRRFDLKEGGTP